MENKSRYDEIIYETAGHILFCLVLIVLCILLFHFSSNKPLTGMIVSFAFFWWFFVSAYRSRASLLYPMLPLLFGMAGLHWHFDFGLALDASGNALETPMYVFSIVFGGIGMLRFLAWKFRCYYEI